MLSIALRRPLRTDAQETRIGLAWLTLLIALVIAASGVTPVTAAERPTSDGAQAFMSNLVTNASAALTSDGTLEAREQRFRTLLSDGFDMRFIARVALGKPWKTLSAAEQNTYTNLFSEFVLKTYASRLGGFDPERFDVLGAAPKGKRDMLVKTKITQQDGGSIAASWRVRMVAGKHKIVDIIVEGISMALNQRQEFKTVVQQHGVAGLTEMLRARTTSLSVQPPA